MSRHIASIKKIFTLALAPLALFFAGCHDVIFDKIMQEVSLEDATVVGDMSSIVRFSTTDADTGDEKRWLYTANGEVWYKDESERKYDRWRGSRDGLGKISYDYYGGEFEGVYIFKMAADKNYVYALGVTFEPDNDEGENVVSAMKLYCSEGPGQKWKEVAGKSLRRNSATIFCTNTCKAQNRSAYIRVYEYDEASNANKAKVYLLSGDTFPAAEAAGLRNLPVNAEGAATEPNRRTHAAAYFNGSVYLMNEEWRYSCVATNETLSDDATYLYYSDDERVYYTGDGSTWQSFKPGTDSAILSMAVTKDSVLFGTRRKGISKVANNNGVPEGSLKSFDTNADSAIGAPYEIRALLCDDPSQTEKDASLYACVSLYGSPSSSTGSFDDVGMWSYYPGRGNWNRE